MPEINHGPVANIRDEMIIMTLLCGCNSNHFICLAGRGTVCVNVEVDGGGVEVIKLFKFVIIPFGYYVSTCIHWEFRSYLNGVTHPSSNLIIVLPMWKRGDEGWATLNKGLRVTVSIYSFLFVSVETRNINIFYSNH